MSHFTHIITPNESLWKLENIKEVTGFSIGDLYKNATKFYKEKEKCGELQLDYLIRLKFMAFFKQAKYGVFNEELADCGWFDLVGNDAKKEWKKLGDISRDQAMLEFVRLLDIVCPLYRPYLDDQRKQIEAFQKPTLGEAKYKNLDELFNKNGSEDSKEILLRYQQQRQKIQEALNKQTYHQFLAYAQQTYPGESLKQDELIKQLQDQHYEQYMSQVYAQQAQAQAASLEALTISKDNNLLIENETNLSVHPNSHNTDSDSSSGSIKKSYLQQGLEYPLKATAKNQKIKCINENEEGVDDEDEESDVSDEEGQRGENLPSNPKIAPASLWNSKTIVEFKNAIRKDAPEGVLKIGHGETIRVPTHEEGNCLFWEFATDHYDIGFGVYFEWTIAENNNIVVQVSESSDEELDEDELATAAISPGDIEGATGTSIKIRDPNKPHVDEVIPVFRRDCHEEV